MQHLNDTKSDGQEGPSDLKSSDESPGGSTMDGTTVKQIKTMLEMAFRQKTMEEWFTISGMRAFAIVEELLIRLEDSNPEHPIWPDNIHEIVEEVVDDAMKGEIADLFKPMESVVSEPQMHLIKELPISCSVCSRTIYINMGPNYKAQALYKEVEDRKWKVFYKYDRDRPTEFLCPDCEKGSWEILEDEMESAAQTMDEEEAVVAAMDQASDGNPQPVREIKEKKRTGGLVAR